MYFKLFNNSNGSIVHIKKQKLIQINNSLHNHIIKYR